MATERDVYEIDTTGAVTGLRSADAAAASLEATGRRLSAGASSLSSALSSATTALTAKLAAAQLATRALTGLYTVVKDGAAAYLEAEKSVRMLDSALRLAGAPRQMAAALQDQATALELLTGKSAESTQAIQTMLATLGVSPRQIAEVTESAMRLAEATGQDASAAARTLAQAYTSGSGELKKYGIDISDAEIAAKGFSAVLDEVNRRFPPLGEQLTSQQQSVNALKMAWSDATKAVGEAALTFAEESGLMRGLARSGRGLNFIVGKLREFVTGAKDVKDVAADFDVVQLPAVPLLPGRRTSPDAAAGAAQGRLDEEARKKRLEAARAYAQALEREDKRVAERDKAEREHLKRMAEEELRDFEEAKKKKLEANKKFHEEMRREEEKQLREAAAAAKRIEEEKARELKQIQHDLRAGLKQMGESLLVAWGQQLGEALTSNTKFTARTKALAVERETAGLSEADAASKRANMERTINEDRAAGFLKVTADMLAQVAIQAGIKAVYEGGEAIAAAARYDYAAATQHGIAAGIYAGLAVAAGGTSAAISAARPMTSDERQQLDAAATQDQQSVGSGANTAAAAAAPSAPETSVNVYYLGISGMTELQQSQELARVQRGYAELATGGAP